MGTPDGPDARGVADSAPASGTDPAPLAGARFDALLRWGASTGIGHSARSPPTPIETLTEHSPIEEDDLDKSKANFHGTRHHTLGGCWLDRRFPERHKSSGGTTTRRRRAVSAVSRGAAGVRG